MKIPSSSLLNSIQCKELIAEYKINAKLVECFSSDYIYVRVDFDDVCVYRGTESEFELLTLIDINLYNYNVNEIVKKIVVICSEFE